MPTLNLGILAHADTGKASLTGRLLFAAGVIDEIGSVVDGSAQTRLRTDKDAVNRKAYLLLVMRRARSLRERRDPARAH